MGLCRLCWFLDNVHNVVPVALLIRVQCLRKSLHKDVKHAISQLQIVLSGLHLITYLDVGNFCDKSTETTLHDVCMQVFLRFSDSSKPEANQYR